MSGQQTFSKLTSADFESRPQRIETDRQFPLHLTGQKHLALNVANIGRRPKSDRPAFRFVGIYSNVEDATRALEDSRSEGCDGIISPLHTPLLLSKDTNQAGVDDTIHTVIDRCKQADKEQQERIKERVEYTRALSGKSGDNNEEFKAPEVPVCMPTGASKGTMKNLDSDAIVVSIVGANEPEPVIVVYGQFRTLEDAKIYTVNTLREHTEFDVSIVAVNEWYAVDSFAVQNTDLTQVEYFDQGLGRLMDLAKNARDKSNEIKHMIKPEDYIAPEPDLLEPAPTLLGATAAKQLLMQGDDIE